MSVFIISEIGINHNGDVDLAKQMIKFSKEAGADAVKFQKRDINLVYSEEFLSSKRESPWGITNKEQKKGLEFSKEQYDEIDLYCKKIDIIWFASAWDLNSLDFLSLYDLKYNKIASAMIVDLNFLRSVARKKKYTFISTGMCNFSDIDAAVKIFREEQCKFELMHCISAYPFLDELANIKLINTLQKKYNCKVGYSGHEKGGIAVSYAAVAIGATSLERHITLDRSMYGSDQAASLEPSGLRLLIGGCRTIVKALGDGRDKKILDIEKPVAKKLREHIKN